MKDLKWPAVVLVASVLIPLIIVLGWLSYQGKDATTLLAGVGLVLTALGFGYQFNKTSEIQQSTAKIEENTNGRIGQLTATVEQQRLDIAAANEAHSRAVRDMADQHRRDMREMADKLATMMPAEVVPPTGKEQGHSPDL